MALSLPEIKAAMMAGKDAGSAIIQKAKPAIERITHEARQEGPFLRVHPAGSEPARGIREEAGLRGHDVPPAVSDAQVKQFSKDPNNHVKSRADAYSRAVLQKPYSLPDMPESSLAKQSAIGRTFMHAVTEDPEYKKAVFDAYKRQMPDLITQHNIKDYDDLVNKSYSQLAKETEAQFNTLPVSMSFHQNGEGNYLSSNEMMKDVLGNNHLYVYQGGDPHEFLNAVDPVTGLNTNEKFRAVHDYYGHAAHGNSFGPKGEETAWGAHSQMFSPLAKLAMTSETRGQNSVVNYTPLNANLKKTVNALDDEIYEAKRSGDLDRIPALEARKKDAYNNFQFAPQKSVILPPEFQSTSYTGGMPSYIQPLIKPAPGTAVSSELTHFSPSANLSTTDPTRYGTGIAGAEADRLKNYSGAVKDRTYFYAGDQTPELGLGPYKYGASSNNLYDVSADPLNLATLSKEANRVPYTASANQGLVYNADSDLERMIKEHGYSGALYPDNTKPSAIMFNPVDVQRRAGGGLSHLR
jgi:hypothetical protein